MCGNVRLVPDLQFASNAVTIIGIREIGDGACSHTILQVPHCHHLIRKLQGQRWDHMWDGVHPSVRSQQDYIPWSGLRPTHLLLSQYLLVVREENISVEEGKNISFAGQWRMYIDTRGAICITTLSNPHKCSSHVDSHNKDKMIEIRSVHCKQTQTDMRKAESFPELKLSITRKLQKGCMYI